MEKKETMQAVPLKAVLGFDEKTHRYYNAETGETIISVTQLLAKHGLAPNYGYVDPEVLKRKAEAGTLVHKEIERWINEGVDGLTLEFQAFKAFAEEQGLHDMFSEEMVCNDIVAGTLDLIADDKDGAHILFDIKTTYDKHPFEWAWQISLYAYLTKEVFDGYAVIWVREDKDGEVRLEAIPVERIPDESIEALLECERQGTIYKQEITVLSNDDIAALMDVEAFIYETEAKLKEAKEREEAIKAAALEAMKKNNLKTFETGKLKFTYVAPSVRKTVDTKKLQAEQPEVYNAYLKESTVKESLRIAVK